MNTIKEMIREIQGLQGANVEIFGQPTTLSNEVGEFEIDVCDFIEEFDGMEVDLVKEVYNEEEDDYEEVEIDSIEEYLDNLEMNFGLREIQCNNTYNWLAPINHHFNFRIYESLDVYYMVLSIHRYGDVRGNYTDEVLIKFDGEWELQEKFYENEESFKVVEVELNGKKYDVNVNLWSDTMEVYDEDGSYVCSTCEHDEESIIKDLEEKIQ